ncbi:hypothetical protein KXD40_007153 [Peronospora effusa]|uniref:Uncharacterized protein n=1 Tax=Peronospora effusa TaxID=542832 RepID=A0A3M6VFK8_9STRA|nr:hypothetical protein DD238_007154 [Peronospora effusa]RQM09511.1 hypothetical protein DD237_007536 [Peronospora effusa]UIZ28885.1 hypothetical protein KXD40_007153 [Peronospora effusa]
MLFSVDTVIEKHIEGQCKVLEKAVIREKKKKKCQDKQVFKQLSDDADWSMPTHAAAVCSFSTKLSA